MAQSKGKEIFIELIKFIIKSISTVATAAFSKIFPGVRLPKFTKSLLEGLLVTALAWGLTYGFIELFIESSVVASLGPGGAVALIGGFVLLCIYYGIIKPVYQHYQTYQANLRVFQEDRTSALKKIENNPDLQARLRHGTKARTQYLNAKQQECQDTLQPLSSIAPKLTINGMEWETIKSELPTLELPENPSDLTEENKKGLQSLLKGAASDKTKRHALRALLYDPKNPEGPIPTSKLLQKISPETSPEFITSLETMEAFQSGDVKALQAMCPKKTRQEILVAADIASRVNKALAGGKLINGEVIEIKTDDALHQIAKTVLKRGVELTYPQVCLFREIINMPNKLEPTKDVTAIHSAQIATTEQNESKTANPGQPSTSTPQRGHTKLNSQPASAPLIPSPNDSKTES